MFVRRWCSSRNSSLSTMLLGTLAMATNVASLRVMDLFRGLSFAYFAPPRKQCVCESFSCVEAPSPDFRLDFSFSFSSFFRWISACTMGWACFKWAFKLVGYLPLISLMSVLQIIALQFRWGNFIELKVREWTEGPLLTDPQFTSGLGLTALDLRGGIVGVVKRCGFCGNTVKNHTARIMSSWAIKAMRRATTDLRSYQDIRKFL